MDALLRSLALGGLLTTMMTIGCETHRTHEEYVEATPYPTTIDPDPFPQDLYTTDRATTPSSQVSYQDDPYSSPAPTTATLGYDPNPYQSTYTIRKGDTLWSIAKRNYNDGKRWHDIQSANPGINPNRLRVGQEIILP